jgi:phage host-nuclease inhibitor protein Gam
MFNRKKIQELQSEIVNLKNTLRSQKNQIKEVATLHARNAGLVSELNDLQKKVRQQCEADILWEAEKIKRGETPDMNVLNRLHALSLQDLAMQQRIGLSQPSALSGIFGRFI